MEVAIPHISECLAAQYIKEVNYDALLHLSEIKKKI
jgi:hypothetical protein